MKSKSLMVVTLSLLLISCGGSGVYDIGVFNNTEHKPVKIKIQYPSLEGMKWLRFSMINLSEFKSNELNTNTNPIPEQAKISWENSGGEPMNEVVDLTFVPQDQDGGAIIFDIDEYGASVKYLNKEEFSGEWEKRLIRKGYK